MANILSFQGKNPKIHNDTFIADNTNIIGNVEISSGSSIWFNSVLRGDVAKIIIGANTNIQDNTTIHGTRPNHHLNKTKSEGGIVTIGNNVTIGHNCIIHACTIASNTFIGMGSILMDLAIINQFAMLGAGSLVSPGTVIPSNELWLGKPAKFKRKLTDLEIAYISKSAKNYYELSRSYLNDK